LFFVSQFKEDPVLQLHDYLSNGFERLLLNTVDMQYNVQGFSN